METFTAGQIADSLGAYSGREVKFTYEGGTVIGTLDRSSDSGESRKAILTVNGTAHWVARDIIVKVR